MIISNCDRKLNVVVVEKDSIYDMYTDPTEKRPITLSMIGNDSAAEVNVSWNQIAAHVHDQTYRKSMQVLLFAFMNLRADIQAFLGTRKREGIKDPVPQANSCKVPNVFEVLPF